MREDDLWDRIVALEVEVSHLRNLLEVFAERISKQSELLSKRAERWQPPQTLDAK